MGYLHNLDWETTRDLMIKLGLPVTAKELGLKDEEVLKALEIAHDIRPERYTVLGKEGLTSDAAAKVASVTGVIN